MPESELVPGHSRAGREPQVIELRLTRAHDMFEVPQTDLFSEHHNFLTGIDYCVSELRSRRSRRPVRLEIGLPEKEIDAGVVERLAWAVRRYCSQQLHYDHRESRALRAEGISALRVGVPVTIVGLVLVAVATGIRPSGGVAQLIVDHLGWVLAWVGLWFPLDQFLFSPLAYGRESRVLRLLSHAELTVFPLPPAGADKQVGARGTSPRRRRDAD